MTAAGLHHLPDPDDAALQHTMDALEDAGVDLTPGRRTVLSALHQFGWLTGQDGVGAMLTDAVYASTRESKAAAARRLVRAHRDAADTAEARYHASLPPVQESRDWHLTDDGRGFRCGHCGTGFGGYIDQVQATDAATDHVKTCKEARHG